MKGDDIARRLVKLGVGGVRMARKLEAGVGTRNIAEQLARSATAVGANYQEARGAESRKDFIHKVAVALKEAEETKYWLEVVAGLEPEARSEATGLLDEAEQLCRILASSVLTARKNLQRLDSHPAGVASQPRSAPTGNS